MCVRVCVCVCVCVRVFVCGCDDYYRIEGRAVLPIRWMAWESVLLVSVRVGVCVCVWVSMCVSLVGWGVHVWLSTMSILCFSQNTEEWKGGLEPAPPTDSHESLSLPPPRPLESSAQRHL